jgi:hypothetical protein
VTFRDITVDQNTSENTTATIRVGEDNTLQHVWQIFGGTNLHFENMHLYVSGVNPIDVNGPTISGVYIARNHIVFRKRAGQPEFDNSPSISTAPIFTSPTTRSRRRWRTRR